MILALNDLDVRFSQSIITDDYIVNMKADSGLLCECHILDNGEVLVKHKYIEIVEKTVIAQSFDDSIIYEADEYNCVTIKIKNVYTMSFDGEDYTYESDSYDTVKKIVVDANYGNEVETRTGEIELVGETKTFTYIIQPKIADITAYYYIEDSDGYNYRNSFICDNDLFYFKSYIDSIVVNGKVTNSIYNDEGLRGNITVKLFFKKSVNSYNLNNIFAWTSITSVDFSNLDTKTITGLNGTFYYCNKLTRIIWPNVVDLTNSEGIGSMVERCTSLEPINIDNWKISSNLKFAYSPFAYSPCLTSVDLSKWDMSGVTDASSLFFQCKTLTSVIIPSMTSTEFAPFYSMFQGDTSLTSVTFTGDINYQVEKNEYAFEGVETTGTLCFPYQYLKNYYPLYKVKPSTWSVQNYDGSKGYYLDLNDQWEYTSAITNPDTDTYDGVYRSFSNKGSRNTDAYTYMYFGGYTEFTFYVRSYANAEYDYVCVGGLNEAITGSTTSLYASTKNNQQGGTDIGSYTKVTYTGLDTTQIYKVVIIYTKGYSVLTTGKNDDCGYILIPKNQ
jgi:hypothetical protein